MYNDNIKLRKTRGIGLIIAQPVHKDVHRKLEGMGYKFADTTKKGNLLYESTFLIQTKEDAADAGDVLKMADIDILDAYVFAKKTNVFVGGKK